MEIIINMVKTTGSIEVEVREEEGTIGVWTVTTGKCVGGTKISETETHTTGDFDSDTD